MDLPTVARMANESSDKATWTVYPSLLSSLETEKWQLEFEAACCALYSGRFADAVAIFDSKLPKSYSKPILALQRADMLTNQGLEHDRIKLIQAALADLSETLPELSSVRLLMQFMLADAEFWAYGRIEPVLNMIHTVKERLSLRDIGDLSDVEVLQDSLHCRWIILT